MTDVLIGVFGLAAFVCALLVVALRQPMRAALALIAHMVCLAALFACLGVDVVALFQVLIYVGAVIVLVLFALMLTRAPIGRQALDNQQRVVAAVVGLGVLAGLVFLIQGAFKGAQVHTAPTTTAEVGASLFSAYVLPFEVVSVLLLAALIGAIVIARKDEGDTP